ncbi:MAG: hypothetical protein QW703_01610 [Candidatus Aenigmatarchaeota archaeon]
MRPKPYQVLEFKNGIAKVLHRNERRIVFSIHKLKRGDWVICHDEFVLKKISRQFGERLMREWMVNNFSTATP